MSRVSWESPKKTQLRIAFVLLSFLAQILAPTVPAFDTSHLIDFRSQGNTKTQSRSANGSGNVISKSSAGSQASSNHFLPTPHLDSSSPRVAQLVDSAGLRWDALHYQAIALHGSYIFEHQYAFSPGVPIMLRLVSFGKHYSFQLLDRLLHGQYISSRLAEYLLNTLVPLVKAGLIGLLSSEPCLEIYKLTLSITQSNDYAYLTFLVFIIMGAPPVFFRNSYAEPFFAYFSFKGMHACYRESHLSASLYFALATSFRSNGTILSGFLLYDLLARPVFQELVSAFYGKGEFLTYEAAGRCFRAIRQIRLRTALYAFILCIIVISPFAAQQYLAYQTFCIDPDLTNALLPRPWCSARLPLIYSFAQSHYWDVGLWRYWTPSQIPNFLLAAPMLLLVGGASILFLATVYRASTAEAKFKGSDRVQSIAPLDGLSLAPQMTLTLLPYALHALVLSLLLFTTAHVQIALRVLPAATPWASWAGAALVMKGVQDREDGSWGENTSGAQARHSNQEVSVRKVKIPSARTKKPGSWWTLVSHIWIGWSIVWLFVSSVLWLAFLPPA
ncbi:ER membrane glycoprotein subunit of the GPI transamidase complex-like protein [Ceratobasidium sp. 428]|nr:ER membrane glycoprotein subunit of the GPI transamidase complex-like protein [Ceratobasidium sp. 428]